MTHPSPLSQPSTEAGAVPARHAKFEAWMSQWPEHGEIMRTKMLAAWNAASVEAPKPQAETAKLLMQDENSGRDGRRYNEWHASRPDAKLNAREAAAAFAGEAPTEPSTVAKKLGDGARYRCRKCGEQNIIEFNFASLPAKKPSCCGQTPCTHPGVGPCDKPAVPVVQAIRNGEVTPRPTDEQIEEDLFFRANLKDVYGNRPTYRERSLMLLAWKARATLALNPEPAQQADKYTTLVNAGMPPSEAYRLAQQAVPKESK